MLTGAFPHEGTQVTPLRPRRGVWRRWRGRGVRRARPCVSAGRGACGVRVHASVCRTQCEGIGGASTEAEEKANGQNWHQKLL